MNTETPEQIFLRLLYPEIKDLGKHFLTLISATIVFSLTFAEKIIDFATASITQKVTVIGAYVVLVGALGCCGLGIYTVFMAAEQASGSVIYNYGSDFKALTRVSYRWLDGAGLLYGMGLVLLIGVALSRFWYKDG